MSDKNPTVFSVGDRVLCIQGGLFPTSPKVGQTYTVAQAGEYTMRLEGVESWVYCSKFVWSSEPEPEPKQRLVIHTEVRREMWSEHDKGWGVQQVTKSTKIEDIR